MFKIVNKQTFTGDLFLLDIEVPAIAVKAKPGQHVNVYVNPDSPAITVPISYADEKAGTLTLVERARDLPSEQLMMLQQGDAVFQVRGPLGSAIGDEAPASVVLAGEGIGVASLLWRARAYKQRGAYTICVIGFATRREVFWGDEFGSVSDELYVVTEDGSYGVSGGIVGPIRAICETHKEIDRLVVIAQLRNMKRAAKIAHDNGIMAAMSFDAVRPAAGSGGIFGDGRDRQESFGFARAAELDATQIDFDKLIARERELRESAGGTG